MSVFGRSAARRLPSAAVAAVAVAVVVVAGIAGIAVTGCGSTQRASHPVLLVYSTQATAAAPVDEGSLLRTIQIMQARARAMGVTATIRRTGSDAIEVRLPDGAQAPRVVAEIGATAQLDIYDWETNVIGPGGTPAPTDAEVTGDLAGDGPGGVESGLPYYQAVLLGAQRAPILRTGLETTWQIGCTAEGNAAVAGVDVGCVFGQWYLLDTTVHRVFAGPDDTRAGLFADGLRTPAHHTTRAVLVNPGTVLVEATPELSGTGQVTVARPDSWYVLDDRPVLDNLDITDPQAAVDNGPGGTGTPIVTFGFTARGGSAFHSLTRAIAQRGLLSQVPGVTKAEAVQHFAIVLDDQLITVPYIDYTANPDGIDAAYGSVIEGGFTPASARELVQELATGPLPLRLTLISQTRS